MEQVLSFQVLDTEEIKPTLLGDLRVIDSETGESREMSVSPALLARYQESFDRHCGDIENFCTKYGLNYFRVSTDLPIEDLIMSYMRRGGFVK